MKLIIGGYAQNKLTYVRTLLQEKKTGPCVILDETSPFAASGRFDLLPEDPDLPESGGAVILNHLHLLIRAAKKEASGSLCPDTDWILRLEERCGARNTELFILCDELGCGVVPFAREDRVWREDVGRILCDLAARAESVDRIVCGIPVRIKEAFEEGSN